MSERNNVTCKLSRNEVACQWGVASSNYLCVSHGGLRSRGSEVCPELCMIFYVSL